VTTATATLTFQDFAPPRGSSGFASSAATLVFAASGAQSAAWTSATLAFAAAGAQSAAWASGTVQFQAPPPADPTTSTVVAAPLTVPADGTSASTIVVTLRDASGNPTPGKTVRLREAANRGAMTPATAVTGASGIATFSVTDTGDDLLQINAVDVSDNLTLPQGVTITFTPVPLGGFPDAYSVLHSFGWPDSNDGRDAFGRLVQATDGYFYGTTTGGTGGVADAGAIFRVDARGNYTVLHSFTSGTDGSFPSAGLVQARDGAFYGTTVAGGAGNFGTVYRIDASGNFTVLHHFGATATDGGRPSNAALIEGNDGRLYGTAVVGGSGFGGTIFSVALDGTFTLVHDFTGNDGSQAVAGMIKGSDGAFYGATMNGGSSGRGTIYRIDANGNFAVLHQFGSNDGFVQAPLIQGRDGAFYGTSPIAGPPGNGAVFRVDLAGNYSWLAAFPAQVGTTDLPIAPLAQDTAGNLLGTLLYGGTTANAGVIYRIDTAGVLTFIHEFNGLDGAQPTSAGLVRASDGAFYGTTTSGGAYGAGTVFKITPAGAFTVVHNLTRADGGGLSSVVVGTSGATMITGTDGAIYGTFADGGITEGGVVFRVAVTSTAPPALSVAVSETVHVSDAVVAQPAVMIALPESVRIADGVGALPAAMIAVSEAVNVTETAAALPARMIAISEAVQVADAVSAVREPTPSQLIAALIDLATRLSFQQGAALLRNLQSAVARGNRTAACNQLSAFLNQLRAQEGKSLTVAQAAELSRAAAQISAALGCQ
jgi:uncharacterized repeat protein (TIGR03803 family)